METRKDKQRVLQPRRREEAKMRQGTVLQENCDVSGSGRPLVVDGREAHTEGLDGRTTGTGPEERRACRSLPPKFMFTLLICGKFDTTLGVDQRGSGHGSRLD